MTTSSVQARMSHVHDVNEVAQARKGFPRTKAVRRKISRTKMLQAARLREAGLPYCNGWDTRRERYGATGRRNTHTVSG